MTSALANEGFGVRDGDRKALNAMIREGGVFDAFVDFDRATVDAATGALRAEYAFQTFGGGKRAITCIPIARAIWPWGTLSISMPS